MDMVNAFSLANWFNIVTVCAVAAAAPVTVLSSINVSIYINIRHNEFVLLFAWISVAVFLSFFSLSLSSIIKIGIARSVTLLFWFGDSVGRVIFFSLIFSRSLYLFRSLHCRFISFYVCARLLSALNKLFRPDSVDSMKCVKNCSMPKVNETVNRVIRFVRISDDRVFLFAVFSY